MCPGTVIFDDVACPNVHPVSGFLRFSAEDLAQSIQSPGEIVRLLQFLCEEVGADGVIYWHLAPGSIVTRETMQGRFSPVASWCRFDDIKPWYFLPVDSHTGHTWLEELDYKGSGKLPHVLSAGREHRRKSGCFRRSPASPTALQGSLPTIEALESELGAATKEE